MKDKGIKWFPQLTDKSESIWSVNYAHMRIHRSHYTDVCYLEKSIKVHLYWAMKNCGGSAEKLKALIENIPAHYQVGALNDGSFHHYCCHIQGHHAKCASSSPCHTSAYEPSKVTLTDKKAIASLGEQLKASYIFSYAEDFARVRSLHWV